jgi:uncharacterized protein involved in response to NO
MTVLHMPDARLLAAAPHRLLFFVGAGNVLLAMAWWTFWLINARWQLTAMPQLAIPAGWLHAFIMQYQVLPSFMFGFLLTVFPRWMGLPAYSKWQYVPVGFGLLAGQALTLVSLFGFEHLLFLGVLLTLSGWLAGCLLLALLLWRDQDTTWHAISAFAALLLGVVGIGLMFAYLFSRDGHWMFAAIKFGGFGLLLPVYFTVCHRMLPFFAGAALAGYKMYRPMWALALFWLLALMHLGMELAHAYAWLWLADLPLVGLSAWLLWRWWPRARTMPALLKVLMVGFAWLPAAALLYSVQSLWLMQVGGFVLGRAPAHALFIGFFGSLLVAMVTRVTQGHSGRPLQLGGVAAFAFIVIQIAALVRIGAELATDILAWHSAAGLLWLLAFLPWVLRSLWIYLTPRADGKAD